MHVTKRPVTTALFGFNRKSPDLARLAARIWLAARVGAWLCLLPLRWRARGLTTVLEQMGPARRPTRIQSSEIESIVRLVRRVAGLRLFRIAIFPRPCLREALALYHILSRAGQPVEFCVGVLKSGESFLAHSWVTLQGNPINPADRGGRFRVLYSYPDRRAVGFHLNGA
jgi:hypothetical protein